MSSRLRKAYVAAKFYELAHRFARDEPELIPTGRRSTIGLPLSPGGGFPEIQFLVADVDNAVVLEKEVGAK